MSRGRVLVLGADGFIGRHIAFALRAAGWHVTAHARRPQRLAAMGFDTLRADLTDPACHDPSFWAPALAGGSHIVNAAGVLAAPDKVAEAVHVTAPRAAYAALDGGRAVLISAAGIDADTRFAQWRRAGEAAAAGATILRPGLVMADTSYGGTSLARGLAAAPLCVPVVGDGAQPLNPIHAADLAAIVARCLEAPPPPGVHSVGGPDTVSQTELLAGLRAWLGLRAAPVLRLPPRLARAMGAVGDAMRLGPISATAVAQLEHRVHAPLSPALAPAPRGVRAFLNARPAGTQDLWHARLFLARPAVRLVLALLWLASGLLGLLLPPESFLPLVAAPVPDALLIAGARLGGVVDLGLAALILRGWRPRVVVAAQALMVLGYTAAFTLLAPALWLLPLGGLLKNIPILALIALAYVLEDER